MKCHFYPVISGTCTFYVIMIIAVRSPSCGSVSFSTVKLVSLFISYPLEGSRCAQLTYSSRVGSSVPPPLWGNIYIIYLEFCRGHFVLLCKLFWLCPLGTLSCLLCPFSLCACVEYFLTFWCYKMLQAHLVYILPQSQNQPFLRGVPVPESQIWVLAGLTTPRVLFFKALSAGRAKK